MHEKVAVRFDERVHQLTAWFMAGFKISANGHNDFFIGLHEHLMHAESVFVFARSLGEQHRFVVRPDQLRFWAKELFQRILDHLGMTDGVRGFFFRGRGAFCGRWRILILQPGGGGTKKT